MKFQKTVNECINKGHVTKIKTVKQNTNIIINYIPNHGVTSINKPDKPRVVFNAEATYDSTSLNKSLLKEPDLLNDLVE